MKLIMENWRSHLKEAERPTKSFMFSEDELKALNKSVARITSMAKKILGAEGAIPYLTPRDLEAAELEPQRMVAEDNDAEVTDLRQRYHGPGGELEKSGPRAVKDLEKPISRMSARDFEASGHVMKVPEEVLEDFRTMVEETKHMGDLYEQARDWYHDIRGLLDQETKSDRDSALLGMLIATYSPRAKFALNLSEASFMFKAVQMDAKENPNLLKKYLETFPGSEKRTPGESRGFTNASKVPNFTLNLVAPELSGSRDKETGEMKYDDMFMWNSTIDTWMIDAFYPLLKRSSTSKEWEGIKGKLMSNVISYRYMAQLVAQEAKGLNLLPHELQAIVWVSMQIRQTGDSSLGVTTEFATNQIKEAIENIKLINRRLGQVHGEFEDKTWLQEFFDEIDTNGFESAEKYLLGIKDEKGKVTASGVRSITSKGKKGSAFKYYEPPEDDIEIKPTVKKKKKPIAPGAPVPKAPKSYANPEYSELNTHYVMNNIIQMPTGKFNNLYDSITLYLDPEFSTQKAVDHILGRFDPEATSTKGYFR